MNQSLFKAVLVSVAATLIWEVVLKPQIKGA